MKKEELRPCEIIVHLTGTADDVDYERASELEEHFADSGIDSDPVPFHYLITLDGLRSIGRNKREICHHCEGHDEISYSIMIVGGVDHLTGEERDTTNEKQVEMLAYTIKELRLKYPGLRVMTPHEVDPYCAEVEVDLERVKP